MSKFLEYFKDSFDDTVTEKAKYENQSYVAYAPEDGVMFTELASQNFLILTALEDNSTVGLVSLSKNQILEYYIDNVSDSWNVMNNSTIINLNNNERVFFKGNLTGDNDIYNGDYTQFKMTGKIAASGNCNGIWNYGDLNAPLKYGCGYCLFRDCSSLITAPRILPATELSDYCYGGMFYNCVNLTTVPELPATELSEGCYYNMFSLCNSLTRVQKILPATTLTKGYEYTNMFASCKSLIESPELPATTLAESSYEAMFWNCASLTSTPKLPATKLAKNCYKQMFQECPNITMTPVLPAKELADHCYYGMFYLCTKLTTASDILGTKQDSYSCAFMFSDCTSLTKTQRILPATILASYCYNGMFLKCASLRNTPILPAATLAEACYQSMFSECTSLTAAPTLSSTELAPHCYRGMFSGCTSLTTAPKILPATKLAVWCYQNMFWQCTSLTVAPILPSPELVDRGYLQMFYGCSKLNSITCLAEGDIQYSKATESWTYGVAPTGTFYKHPDATWISGNNGIPGGWTILDAEIS